VIEEAALRLQIIRAGHIDGEFAAEEREEFFFTTATSRPCTSIS